MAKISILSTDAGRTFTAGANDEIIGTSASADLIYVDPSANGVVVNGNGGGDVVTMAGSVSDYTVAQDGSRIKLINAEGGATYIALSASATTINFADATAEAKVDGTNLMLGTQIVTGITTPAGLTGTSIFTSGTGVMLKDGQDVLNGTSGNDTFTSYILDNSNTFESGDIINGGAGTDTLNAEIGNSQNFAIGAKTTSLENVFIQAQTTLDSAEDDSDNYVTYPYDPTSFSYDNASHDGFTQIDAQNMKGVRQLWSDNSRANLVIEDVRENSHTTTIGMRDTDPGDVNYEVYFNPQHITAPGADASGAALFLQLLDLDGMRTDGKPLLDNPYNGFSFTLDGVRVVVQPTAPELVIGNGSATFQDVVDAINSELHRPVSDGGLGLTQLSATIGGTYSAIHSDTGVVYTANEIVIENSGSGVLGVGSWLTPTGEAPPDTNVLARQSDIQPVTIEQLTQVDVILDNVARGDVSGSGDLVIGDMSLSGIQQFNVEVQHSSHIDQLASTNNILEVVNVVNGSVDRNVSNYAAHEALADEGNLRINKLDDVRVFDASAMTGAVDLTAYLSAAVAGKYMNLVDTASTDAGEDAVAFAYTTSVGDDSVTMTIDKANLAAAGTTARDDFNLNITTNEGDDTVTLQIGDNSDETPLGSGLDSSHWYQNSKQNANLQINTGAGDDTINAYGAGDRIINAGTGADTVYIDNSGDYPSGRKAIFVFNTADQFFNDSVNGAREIDDQNGPLGSIGMGLLTDTVESYDLYNTTLTVTFKGFEGSAVIANTSGATDDVEINRAIKEAINNDPELSQLLFASYGPADTLVVESLIDGAIGLDELTVSFAGPDSLTPSEIQTLSTTYGVTATYDAIADYIDNQISALYGRGDYDTAYAETSFGSDYVGVQSSWVGDNHIEGGAGDDVIVLGTGDDSNDTLVYHGYNNGLDTVVNFQVGNAPVDTIDGYPEEFLATFAAAVGPGAFQFDGVQIDIPLGTETAVDVANIVDGLVFPNWTTINNGDGTVTFVYDDGDGNITDVTAADFADPYPTPGLVITDGAAAYTIPAVAAIHESYNVYFNTTTAIGSLTFNDGTNTAVVANIPAGSTPAAVAALVAAGADTALWTVTDNLDGTVTFTSVAADSTTADLSSANFSTAPATAGILSNIVQIEAGAAATPAVAVGAVTESFVATFANAYDTVTPGGINDVDAGFILFAGEEIPVLRGDTGTDIAAQAALGSYTGWTAAAAVGNTVTFTSTTAGTDVTDPVFTYQLANSLVVDVTDGYGGLDELSNVDYVDFSEYLGAAFADYDLGDAEYLVTSALVAGSSVVIANNPGSYFDTVTNPGNIVVPGDFVNQTAAIDEVLMVESNINDGEYNVYHVSHAASATATAVSVDLIGTIDFGFELAPGAPLIV